MSRTIRSHRARVLAAKRFLERNPEVSRFAREAYVEFFLLEDIEQEYVARERSIMKMNPRSAQGERAKLAKLEAIGYLLHLWEACVDLLQVKLGDKEYADVRKAINEHKLMHMMRMGDTIKQLQKLVELTEGMLWELDERSLEVARIWRQNEERMEEYDIHHKVAFEYYGLPNANNDKKYAPADVVPVVDDIPTEPAQQDKKSTIINE